MKTRLDLFTGKEDQGVAPAAPGGLHVHCPLPVVGGRRVHQAQDPHLPSPLGSILGSLLDNFLGTILGTFLGRIRIKTAVCGGFS